MIIDKDRKIYDFVNKYGCITVKQAKLMFYPNTAYGSDSARNRLNNLTVIGWLKSYRDTRKKVTIYYENNKYSYHRVLLLDYYAYLVNIGCDIAFFKPEYEWMNGKVRSDGFIAYTFNNKPYFNFIEVVTSYNEINIEKYDKLFETGEAQKICVGNFPPVVLIDNVKRKKEINLKYTTVIKLDFNLTGVAKVLSI